MIPSTGPDLIVLFSALADRRRRSSEAAALAKRLGALDFLILLPDPDLGILRPAPGFRQTLPGGSTWTELLARCKSGEEFHATVAYPDARRLAPADVFVAPDGPVLMLIGGQPVVRASEIADAAETILALLQSEVREEAASASAKSSGDATRRATALASSLDRARADLASNALALRAALSDAARLNDELRLLNAELEARVSEEVAERMKAEAALRQTQKMEAIGQLTGGVAHDFNNLLTVVMGGLEAIQKHVALIKPCDPAQRIERAASLSMQGAQKAATLTKRLLAFARRQPLDPKPIDAGQLVTGLADLLQRTLGETVRLETVNGAGLWLTQADPGELENTLMNLAINARDAMPDGGRLTIETSNAYLDDAYVEAITEPVSAGQYVLIAVSDTGSGIPEDVLAQVFEPFFTTKEVGKGTGLGLSQAYGFVRQSSGNIKIYSEPGEGTTVKIYLPRLASAQTPELLNRSSEPERVHGGSETILVVEDHDDLRAFSVGVLTDLGYRVLSASSGSEAINLVKDEPIDLLFTDVVLPDGMNGRRVADAVATIRPRAKVLFTTGYTANAIVHNGRLDAGVQLISKPFSASALGLRVRKLLDQTSDP
ncbi:MAG TPA: ATP-binding protein [Brevundimonas sp.]|nr:ATP-binding protein [Brevundimonas sp.]